MKNIEKIDNVDFEIKWEGKPCRIMGKNFYHFYI